VDKSVDVTSLKDVLYKLERQLDELMTSSDTRYAPQQHRDELKTELEGRVSESDRIKREFDGLRRCEGLMRSALYVTRSNEPHRHYTLAQLILLTLHNKHSIHGIYTYSYCIIILSVIFPLYSLGAATQLHEITIAWMVAEADTLC